MSKIVNTSKIVNIDMYSIDNDKVFIMCTAKWCGPCRLIKPTALEFIKDKTLISSKEMNQEEYQSKITKYIPFFIVSTEVDFENFIFNNSIQTSNKEELTIFMGRFINVGSNVDFLENDIDF
jgi:thiol-disulfide isomerase/thioredoxin